MAITRLHMFDYDGLLVATGSVAAESLVQAALAVVPEGYCQSNLEKLKKVNLPQILEETAGTTELNLAMKLANFLNVGTETRQRKEFAERFYQARVAYLRKHSLLDGISLKEATVGRDILYEDAFILLHKLRHQNRIPEEQREFHNVFYLVTGNPGKEGQNVMDIRLPPEIRSFFTDEKGKLRVVGGDEAETRNELIELAIAKSGVEPVYSWRERKAWRDFRFDFATNIFHYDDQLRGIEAGLKARVRIIFCPEHNWFSATREGACKINDQAREIIEPFVRPF